MSVLKDKRFIKSRKVFIFASVLPQKQQKKDEKDTVCLLLKTNTWVRLRESAAKKSVS